jgi:mRNA interferase RelE/StbE
VSYRVELSPAAIRDFDALPAKVRASAKVRIDALADQPRPVGSDALAGDLKGLRKLRVGRYRVCYSIDDAGQVVRVIEIGHRRDIYRRTARRR